MTTEEHEHDQATDATADAGVLAAEVVAQRDQYLRLAADFENFKRRKAQEILDRSRYANEEAAVALLPILDNLQRSLEHLPAERDEAIENFINGITIVVREFQATLERLGVTPIDCVGSAFDPALHDAIGAEDSPDVEVDTVIAELQRGYRLHDRILRPAIVRIAHPVAAPKA